MHQAVDALRTMTARGITRQFGSVTAAHACKSLLEARTDLTPITAEDYWRGAYSCDAAYILDEFALECDMNPLHEVWDFCIEDDYGNIGLYVGGKLMVVPGDTIILLSGAASEIVQRRTRSTWVPETVDLRDHALVDCLRGSGPKEQFLTVEFHHNRDKGPRYLVVWRSDARQTRDLVVVSAHSTHEFARYAAEHASETFTPPAKVKTSRQKRDFQRNSVYRWEGRFRMSQTVSLDDARALVARIFSDLGMAERMPSVRINPRLKSGSLFSGLKGIEFTTTFDLGSVVHEAAHAVAFNDFSTRCDGHGPVFLSTYMALLEWYCGADRAEMREHAAKIGVKWKLA